MRVDELVTTDLVELGRSSWRAVEQERINGFADATDDHQWIHVDSVRSAGGAFGATIAHGYLVLSLVPQMVDEALRLESRGMGLNYGINRLRFTGPVRAGTRIRGHVTLKRGDVRPDGGVLLTLDVTVEREGEAVPALVAELLTVVYH